MHALSEQFLLLDKMRKAAGVSPQNLVRRARFNWFRYQLIRGGLIAPSESELGALTRALTDSFVPDSRAPRTSPSVDRAGTAAAHRSGLTSDPAQTRDLRVAPPPVSFECSPQSGSHSRMAHSSPSGEG